MNALLQTRINRQQGVATLLVLIIVGLSITGAVLGSVGYLRSTQDRTTSFHTQSQAQMNAWSGVRAVYQSLDQLRGLDDPPTTAALYEAFDIAKTDRSNLISGTQGLEAFVVEIDGTPNDFQVTVNVHGISMASVDDVRSTSIVQMVLELVDQPATEPKGLESVISFNRGLTLGGSISVQSNSGKPYEINIQGFFDTGGNSISGIDTLKATDSVKITSGSNFKNIFANGDVLLEGSVSISDSIQARGNVCLPGGGTASSGLTRAEGFVSGPGAFNTIEARGESLYEGNRSLCDTAHEDAHGNPFAVHLSGNDDATIEAAGSVFNLGGNVDVHAQGDYHNGYGRGTGQITGIAKYCENAASPNNCDDSIPDWKAGDITVETNEDLTVDIPTVPPVEVSVTGFDAYNYRSSANYAYSVDEDGFKRVTVRNVTGIPSASYYLGSYDGPYKDRLCRALRDDASPANPVCAQPADGADAFPVCWGQSDYNTCFDYNPDTQAWTINGKRIAQGVAWFEGDLVAGNGTYYNTFIVTGNLMTSGSHRNYAPNYAGYSGSVDGEEFAPQGMCTNSPSTHLPKQFCSGDNFNANWANGLGNYLYMAGSYDESGDYAGGDIDLGSSTNAAGSILAGNDYSSGGNTTVAGYITALAQKGTGSSSMGGSTTIDLTQLPPTYDAKAGDPSTSEGSEGGPFTIEVQWARYL